MSMHMHMHMNLYMDMCLCNCNTHGDNVGCDSNDQKPHSARFPMP